MNSEYSLLVMRWSQTLYALRATLCGGFSASAISDPITNEPAGIAFIEASMRARASAEGPIPVRGAGSTRVSSAGSGRAEESRQSGAYARARGCEDRPEFVPEFDEFLWRGTFDKVAQILQKADLALQGGHLGLERLKIVHLASILRQDDRRFQ